MSRAGHGLLITLLVASLACGALPALTQAGTGPHGAAFAQADGGLALNESMPHRHPDEYAESSDLDAVETWLEERLAQRLGDGSIAISEGQYERARSQVGPEYRERLDQYVDVNGDTNEAGAGETSAAFEAAGENQTALATAFEAYLDRLAAYEAALEAGNETEARTIARDLDDRAGEVLRANAAINTSLQTIANGTAANVSTPMTISIDITENVETTRAQIRAELFEPTALSIDSVSDPISFTDPLQVRGTVTTSDGTPVGPTNATILLEGTRLPVQIDEDGSFALEYRPTDLPVGEQALTVRFIPPASSTSLDSATTLSVTVERSTPTIQGLSIGEQGSFTTPIPVDGDVTVDDAPVDGVSLHVLLADRQLQTITVETGAFSEDIEVPVDVPAGEHPLEIQLAHRHRSLESITASRPVTVTETPTTITLDEPTLEGSDLTVTGQLEADGVGIGDQPIVVSGGDDRVTAQTTPSGSFTARLTPEETGDLTVRTSYDDPSTNLAPAEQSRSVTLPTEGSRVPGSPWLWIGLAVIGVVLGALAWRLTRSGDASPPEPSSPTASTETESAPGVRTEPVHDLAADQLADGAYREAVTTAYAAVRLGLGRSVENADALTHWEFVDRVSGDEQRLANLRTVTDAFERARYGDGSIDAQQAQEVLDRSRALSTDG